MLYSIYSSSIILCIFHLEEQQIILPKAHFSLLAALLFHFSLPFSPTPSTLLILSLFFSLTPHCI